LNLLGAVRLYNDSYTEGAAVLERALGEAGESPLLRVKTLTMLSMALLNTGDLDAAASRVEEAVTSAERLGQPQLLSQALGIRTLVRFIVGDGLDEASMRRALALEERDAAMPVAFRPSMQNALLLACTGQLEQARGEMVSIRRRCLERGDESELMFAAFYSVLIEIWRGNFTGAAREAEDAIERALQLGGDLSLFFGLTIRAVLATYAGSVDQARRDTRDALAAGQRCGNSTLVVWTIANAGLLEVSLSEYRAALAIFEPLLASLDATPNGSELLVAAFIPDAVEALIHVGRLAEAEPLIDKLERNGSRPDRAWMLALGARCRAMLLAAHGDLGAATLAAQRAMVEHGRLPMPFESARTQMLLGQLQRRQRQTDNASATLHEALSAFEIMGTPLWAKRASAELARTRFGPGGTSGLTPSEQRVAELAASGMTNRDVAAALFISPKTVEVNLSRIYRKLDIHSRAELGRRMGRPLG
jgi:DNA-binding CsgD family transcriptional regulator